MHTLVLFMWVLGIVSAADDQTQRPGYTISHNGSPQEYSSEQPISGAPVTSNNVKVLPNSYDTSQDLAVGKDSSIPVPVLVNSNTQLQGNTNEPIPVPVVYSDNDSELSETSQPAYEFNPVQTAPFRNVTPIAVLVKAPKSVYRTVTSTPSPFKARDPQLTQAKNTGNPYLTVPPSFRLWPKLPEPVPVPVLTAESFLRSTYDVNTDLVPQYLRKVPIPVKASAPLPYGYQQNQNPVKYPDNSQFPAQQGQSDSFQSRQGPIYIIIPSGNNNAQAGSYQNPSLTVSPYQSQIPQSETQRYIILNEANSPPNYQNSGYSLNSYFGQPVQQGQPGQQQLLNNGVGYGPSNAGSQTQSPAGQQAPINNAAFVPPNAPGSPLQTQYPDQQSALKYAIFGPQSPTVGPANPAGQAPQNYAVLTTGSVPGTQSNAASQSPLTYAGFGSPNLQPAPSQFASYSSAQVPSSQYARYPAVTQQPQYVGYSSSTQQPQFVGYPSSTQQPQYFGYSTTPAPSQPSSNPQPQYVGYSSLMQQPQYIGYSSSPQQPQYAGYSTTPAPFQPSSPQQPQYAGYPTTPAPFQPPSPQQPQYAGYSTTPAPFQLPSTQQPQNVGYSSSTQQPQYVGYSTTPAPSQPNFTQSRPVSSVSYSGPGNSYSYST